LFSSQERCYGWRFMVRRRWGCLNENELAKKHLGTKREEPR